MEYFGSRLVWSSIEDITNPEMGDVFEDENETNEND